MGGVICPERKPADMVQVNPYGDDRWYLAYLNENQPDDGETLFVDVYCKENGEYHPRTYAAPYHRVGLLW